MRVERGRASVDKEIEVMIWQNKVTIKYLDDTMATHKEASSMRAYNLSGASRHSVLLPYLNQDTFLDDVVQ